jgi:hypothetical protein
MNTTIFEHQQQFRFSFSLFLPCPTNVVASANKHCDQVRATLACASIPASHAQSAMHKPHSFTDRRPIALENPLAARVCPKIRANGHGIRQGSCTQIQSRLATS